MEKIKVMAIEEKMELEEMEINDADPCYRFWRDKKMIGEYDCMYDCKLKGVVSAFGSNRH
ncbi:hypothetical protein [Peptostreptococcus sp. D1]|uniref:hypothetical protein n=1 Tax=Peptostreptococcus sp. D1 TaxID=72304 RepID=UPI0008EBFFD1|nr:hypothetical protein [Peptostreptococcus sp. D1]SFE91204.1 hypothetical protein SAMN02910278_02047 [Peptostreptococcus sp. D1]